MNNAEISSTIFEQIGGGRATMMLGGRAHAIPRGLQLTCKGSPKRVSKVWITLSDADLYDVEIFKGSGLRLKSAGKIHDVDASNLKRTLEDALALRLSL